MTDPKRSRGTEIEFYEVTRTTPLAMGRMDFGTFVTTRGSYGAGRRVKTAKTAALGEDLATIMGGLISGGAASFASGYEAYGSGYGSVYTNMGLGHGLAGESEPRIAALEAEVERLRERVSHLEAELSRELIDIDEDPVSRWLVENADVATANAGKHFAFDDATGEVIAIANDYAEVRELASGQGAEGPVVFGVFGPA